MSVRKARLNSLECPYSEHKYRCKKKKWCVVHPSHCAYQSYDILARNKKLTKAFRRPKVIDRCKQGSGICRVCVDEWFFDVIADILDERKELKAQKENIAKKEYKARKQELMLKFEDLGDEYEEMLAKCDVIDELTIESESVRSDTTEEEDPSSFRDMLSAALTRRSSKKKRTPLRRQLSPQISMLVLEPDSEEKASPMVLPSDLNACTRELGGACRGCVDDWYEREYDDNFAGERPSVYLRSASFKKLGDQYQKALEKCN